MGMSNCFHAFFIKELFFTINTQMIKIRRRRKTTYNLSQKKEEPSELIKQIVKEKEAFFFIMNITS